MTIQELYARIGGSYQQAIGVLRQDRLIDRYVCRFPENDMMARLGAAVQRMDGEAIFDSAHAMKGLCGNLGFDRLAAAAEALTEEFRPGSARSLTEREVRESYQALEALYNRTIEGIRAYEREKP